MESIIRDISLAKSGHEKNQLGRPAHAGIKCHWRPTEERPDL